MYKYGWTVEITTHFFPPVSYKERVPSAAQKETKPSASKPAKDAKGKGGKGKEKDKGSRPPSQQFDGTKPNWLLRVVSDGSAAVSGFVVTFKVLVTAIGALGHF